jgi:hypothetical protein
LCGPIIGILTFTWRLSRPIYKTTGEIDRAQINMSLHSIEPLSSLAQGLIQPKNVFDSLEVVLPVCEIMKPCYEALNRVYQPYMKKGVFRYIANKYEANNALRRVHEQQLGFDTEYIPPKKVPVLEDPIQDALDEIPKLREDAEREDIDWDAAQLCVVQIAIPNMVFILDVKRMRGA